MNRWRPPDGWFAPRRAHRPACHGEMTPHERRTKCAARPDLAAGARAAARRPRAGGAPMPRCTRRPSRPRRPSSTTSWTRPYGHRPAPSAEPSYPCTPRLSRPRRPLHRRAVTPFPRRPFRRTPCVPCAPWSCAADRPSPSVGQQLRGKEQGTQACPQTRTQSCAPAARRGRTQHTEAGNHEETGAAADDSDDPDAPDDPGEGAGTRLTRIRAPRCPDHRFTFSGCAAVPQPPASLTF
ncbi:hypothetical protein M2271_007622 [Streptomyces sp. LBL]|nr:hypothetical protein [Streptomyces sp. LBL]